MKAFSARNRACVVGASAPYNHGLPPAGAGVTEKTARGIFSMLFTRGFDATLTFFCTFCVFSVD